MNEPTINEGQTSAQPEQPTLDLSQVTKGCTLRSKRGAEAKVISVESKHGRKDRKPFALNVIIKEAGNERSAKLLPFAQAGWSLWKTAEQVEAEEAAQNLLAQAAPEPAISTQTIHLPEEHRLEPDEDRGVVVPVHLPAVDIEVPVDEEIPMSTEEAYAWAAIRRDMDNEIYAKIDAEDLAEMNPPTGDEQLIPDEELEPDDAEPLNPDRKEIDRLQAEVEDLKQQIETTRQAIALNHESYTSLQEEWLKVHEELHQADNTIIKLTAALDATREQRDSAIEQLDEANKLIESRNEQVATALEASDLTTAPIKEFTILTKVLTGDLARMDKEGWNVEYMQFSEGGDLRAVYSRYCRPAPAPQPERTAAKVVAAEAYIFETPATSPEPAKVALEEAELIGAHARAAADESPLPRFSAEAYMQEVFEASLEASQPVYEAALNPIRPLRPELAAQTPIGG